jgi:hypothetical protein
MRFLLPLLSLCFLFASCYSPERDCEKFKTGTFVYQQYLDGELKESKFIRNDSIEIDVFEGKADTSSIRWINDCEYILRNLNPKNRAEKQAVHMKILTTDGNKYTFEFSMVGQGKKQKGTATKID